MKLVMATHEIQHVPTPSTGLLWNLWHFIHNEIAYDSTHPRFNGRARLFPYDHAFELYPCGTNDDTMTTALVKAFKLAGSIAN